MQPGQHLEVLSHCLGETEARVQYPVLKACGSCLSAEFPEIGLDILHDVSIIAQGIHSEAIPAAVHSHIRQPESSDCRQHTGVSLSGSDVVDHKGADGVIYPSDDPGTEGIDGETVSVKMPGYDLQRRLQALPLLIGPGIDAAGTGAAGPDVDDVGPAGCHLFHPGAERLPVFNPAVSIK